MKIKKYYSRCVLQASKKSSDQKFLDHLEKQFRKIKLNGKLCVICGDFNYDLLSHSKNPNINEFINLMYSHYLHPTILEPTKVISNNRPTLIDNIFVNALEYEFCSGNLIQKISDHLSNFLFIKNIMKITNKTPRKVRNMKISTMRNLNKNLILILQRLSLLIT